jgi:hypothetical protein
MGDHCASPVSRAETLRRRRRTLRNLRVEGRNARQCRAEEHAATEDPSLVPGLVRAQAIVRELEGWPVEDDARIT